MYPIQGRSFPKIQVSLSRSRYWKVQKGQKIEMSHSWIGTHCWRFQCSMVNIQRVIQEKQGVQFFATNCKANFQSSSHFHSSIRLAKTKIWESKCYISFILRLFIYTWIGSVSKIAVSRILILSLRQQIVPPPAVYTSIISPALESVNPSLTCIHLTLVVIWISLIPVVPGSN